MLEPLAFPPSQNPGKNPWGPIDLSLPLKDFWLTTLALALLVDSYQGEENFMDLLEGWYLDKWPKCFKVSPEDLSRVAAWIVDATWPKRPMNFAFSVLIRRFSLAMLSFRRDLSWPRDVACSFLLMKVL
jgi:hypothetical protein